MIKYITSITFIFMNQQITGIYAADIKRDQELHDSDCLACHTTEVCTRKNRSA